MNSFKKPFRLLLFISKSVWPFPFFDPDFTGRDIQIENLFWNVQLLSSQQTHFDSVSISYLSSQSPTLSGARFHPGHLSSKSLYLLDCYKGPTNSSFAIPFCIYTFHSSFDSTSIWLVPNILPSNLFCSQSQSSQNSDLFFPYSIKKIHEIVSLSLYVISNLHSKVNLQLPLLWEATVSTQNSHLCFEKTQPVKVGTGSSPGRQVR